MKKNLLIVALAATAIFFSCKKTETFPSTKPADAVNHVSQNLQSSGANPGRVGPGDSGLCEATTVALIAGQSINSGTVSVTNDDAYIYVTYTTANGYTLTQTHLYVGDCALIPVNSQGNPSPGQFPYASAHNNITSYTYAVPLSAIPAGSCGCIAAHAVVEKRDANGTLIDSQTAWGNGTRINPRGSNWGMSFSYCSCDPGLAP